MGDKKAILDAIWDEIYAREYDRRYQVPTSASSYEYGNEIAHREATQIADDYIAQIEYMTIDELQSELSDLGIQEG